MIHNWKKNMSRLHLQVGSENSMLLFVKICFPFEASSRLPVMYKQLNLFWQITTQNSTDWSFWTKTKQRRIAEFCEKRQHQNTSVFPIHFDSSSSDSPRNRLNNVVLYPTIFQLPLLSEEWDFWRKTRKNGIYVNIGGIQWKNKHFVNLDDCGHNFITFPKECDLNKQMIYSLKDWPFDTIWLEIGGLLCSGGNRAEEPANFVIRQSHNSTPSQSRRLCFETQIETVLRTNN